MKKTFSMLAMSLCLLLFLNAGCSSLHVDVAPTLNWNEVQIVAFKKPAEKRWDLQQSIQSELKSLGFQVTDAHPNPDLLFSYFVQDSRDLTVESEILLRLKSLHIEFIDPDTKARVAAADYFYPETTTPAAPETGVREIFAALRQQILNENLPESKKTNVAPMTTQAVKPLPAPTVPLMPAPTVKTEQIKKEAQADQDQAETSASADSPTRPLNKELPKQEPADSTIQKPVQKVHQAEQKTRSPWIPKFKSWGFENWGEDSVDDY